MSLGKKITSKKFGEAEFALVKAQRPRRFGLPNIIQAKSTIGRSGEATSECPGCFAAKPTFQVGDAEEETLERNRHGLFEVENIFLMWSLIDDSRDNFGTLALNGIEIHAQKGSCVEISNSEGVVIKCKNGLSCEYWFTAYFILLTNRAWTSNDLYWNGIQTAATGSPTFNSHTGMWTYFYDMEFIVRPGCDTPKPQELKLDKNALIETEHLPNLNRDLPASGNPVIIRLSCSDCPNPLV